jgi:hypothetical protein
MEAAPDLAAEIQEEFERTASGAGSISRLFRAVPQTLTPGVARLVVLEDLHWADEASLDLIRLLARRIGQPPVLLLASYRDDQIGSSHLVRVLLGHLAGMSAVHRCSIRALSPDGVAQLAAGQQLAADELYRVTGGKPVLRDRGVGER